ncbi:MAG: ATP-dependent DNA helicase [Bacteroidota bacterium]
MAEPLPPPQRLRAHERFTKELLKLNPGQKQAVEQIEGPVLVIAGPGTGKTHILSARIGRILLETDAKPNNILCLTFTDAGVHAMRERLLQFIGPEAHRVHIYTFHAFCNKIIQDNLELFGWHELEPLSDLERVELIRQLIDELPVDHLLKRKSNNAYFYERHLQDLFKRMKAEDWSVEFINQRIDEYLQSLPEREDYIYKKKTKTAKKGDLKQWKYDAALERMERLRSALRLFPRYVQLMSQANRYDFDDMILWVLRKFDNNLNLLRSYQEQYLYFLVDEYQDTNGAQNHILRKLIEYWNNPNVFIVGDDDQSIYEFQGARLRNLIEFHQTYQADLQLVLLKDNYRSSQHILDTSRAVIDNNLNRIINSLNNQGIEKILQARHLEFASSTFTPQIIEFPNRIQEETAIVAQIEQCHREGFPLAEIAIIYARHRQARNIITLLEKKSIPYTTKRQINILDLPMIRKLRTLLQYIQAENTRPFSGESMLFKLLYFDFFKIAPQDLATLSVHMGRRHKAEQRRWRQLIGNPKRIAPLSLIRPEALLKTASLLEEWIGNASNLALPALLERLFNRSGLLQHLLQQDDQAWLLTVLKTFFDFATKEADRNPRLTLRRFLDILEKMDANRLSIGVNKAIYADEGVRLITAHSSKGLEFQRVFLLDCVRDYWEPTKSSSASRFTFPDTLTFSGEEDAMEARRRLFYVAMTRAKEQLHISYSASNDAGKPLQRAQYIDEILQETNLQIQRQQLSQEQLQEAQHLMMLEQAQPRMRSPGRSHINSLLEGFNLSISSMNTFLRCPLSFYYEYVLQVPVATSEAAAYGTAMHFALSSAFEYQRKQHHYPNLNRFITYYNEELKRQRGHFDKREQERRMEIGRNNLTSYYQQYKSSWPEKALIEYNVRNVQVEGVPLIGTIDRIDLLAENQVHIVDYKTGQPDSSRLKGPSPAQPEGGNYWRQLAFYKLLYEAFQNERTVQSAAISYLEPDSRNRLQYKTLSFSAEELRMVRSLIKTVYEKIRRHEFYEGCGEKDCPWCGFVKHNIPSDSLADLEREALDD